MTHPVFISYARDDSAEPARTLAARLGGQAFLDTAAIDDGEEFPPHLLEAVLGARAVVIFATETYLTRRFCRLEMRLALAAGDGTASHIVMALGQGAEAVLEGMPPSVGNRSWPRAEAADTLETLVRQILDAHPQPLSGALPGAEARRLAAAFLEESSVSQPRALDGIPCSLPQSAAGQSLGPRFVGRAADLSALHRVLSQSAGGSARLTSRIAAGAGFGKTRLAIEYLHRYGPRYYTAGLFWVNAAASSLEDEFWRVLYELDRTVPDLAVMRQQGRNVTRELGRALKRIAGPALYIIDNIPEASAGQDPLPVGHFCPALGAVTVLATSRQDTHEPGVKAIAVETLQRDASILLLTENVPGAGRLSWVEWGRIAEWVGNLPVALDLLNRCLACGSVEAHHLLRRADLPPERSGTTQELDDLRQALRGQVPAGAVDGITEALQISCDKLHPDARALAMVLAQLGPAPIPEAFLEALPPILQAATFRAALRSRHIVTPADERSFGLMHRLTADFLRLSTARYWAGKKGFMHRLKEFFRRSRDEDTPTTLLGFACMTLLDVMTPDRCDDPRQWAAMNPLRAHAEFVFERLAATNSRVTSCSQLGDVTARLAGAQGDHAGARRLQERTLELTTSVLGEEHPQTLMSMGNLALTHFEQGDYTEARRLQVRVSEMSARVLGVEHPGTLTAMSNLAATLLTLGNYTRARQLQERLVEVSARVLGAEHPDTLTEMSNLASTLLAQGSYAGAQRLQERVLEAMARVRGAEHPGTMRAMSLLAATFASQGDHAAARRLQERVREMSARVLGEEHPDTLMSLANLANSFYAQGEHVEARRLQGRVVEVMTRVRGVEHPDTLTALANLATMSGAREAHAEARTLQERAVEAMTRARGEEHPMTLTAMNNLATTLSAQGDQPGARRLHERVLELRTSVLGREHPDTLITMGNLAQTCAAQGDHAEARRLQEAALEMLTRVRGEEHPMTLTAMNNLATMLGAQGDHPGAQRLIERALEAMTRVMGEEHPETQTSMSNLALTCQAQGDHTGARRLQERLLEVRTRVLGEEHSETLTATTNLAQTIEAQGDHAGARRLQERALEVMTRVMGEEHIFTLATMSRLAALLRAQDDHAGALRLQQRLLQVITRALGEEDPGTLATTSNLATMLRAQGDLTGARRLDERVLDARTRTLGDEHPDTLKSMNNLALTLRAQGDHAAARRLQERTLELATRVLGGEHPDTLTVMSNLADTLDLLKTLGLPAEGGAAAGAPS